MNEKILNKIIAGPCAVESYEQLDCIAKYLNDKGIRILRGGAYKPRTNPSSFQGLGRDGVDMLYEMKRTYGLQVVSEVMEIEELEYASEKLDFVQIGSRNMYNYPLLKAAGKLDKPVILKRGMSATIDEWLQAASYIEKEGNRNILLCERGIRTFTKISRNTLDLTAVAHLKINSNYPVIVDPSHATGRKELISPLTKAGLAVGADFIMIEVHNNPDQAKSDGIQSLDFKALDLLLQEIV